MPLSAHKTAEQRSPKMAGLARCLVNRGRRPTFSGFSSSRDGNVYLLCALSRQSHGLAVPRKHLVTLFGTRKRCDMQVRWSPTSPFAPPLPSSQRFVLVYLHSRLLDIKQTFLVCTTLAQVKHRTVTRVEPNANSSNNGFCSFCIFK